MSKYTEFGTKCAQQLANPTTASPLSYPGYVKSMQDNNTVGPLPSLPQFQELKTQGKLEGIVDHLLHTPPKSVLQQSQALLNKYKLPVGGGLIGAGLGSLGGAGLAYLLGANGYGMAGAGLVGAGLGGLGGTGVGEGLRRGLGYLPPEKLDRAGLGWMRS